MRSWPLARNVTSTAGGASPKSAGFWGLASISRSTRSVAKDVARPSAAPRSAGAETGATRLHASPAFRRRKASASPFRTTISSTSFPSSSFQRRSLTEAAFSRSGAWRIS